MVATVLHESGCEDAAKKLTPLPPMFIVGRCLAGLVVRYGFCLLCAMLIGQCLGMTDAVHLPMRWVLVAPLMLSCLLMGRALLWDSWQARRMNVKFRFLWEAKHRYLAHVIRIDLTDMSSWSIKEFLDYERNRDGGSIGRMQILWPSGHRLWERLQGFDWPF